MPDEMTEKLFGHEAIVEVKLCLERERQKINSMFLQVLCISKNEKENSSAWEGELTYIFQMI